LVAPGNNLVGGRSSEDIIAVIKNCYGGHILDRQVVAGKNREAYGMIWRLRPQRRLRLKPNKATLVRILEVANEETPSWNDGVLT